MALELMVNQDEAKELVQEKIIQGQELKENIEANPQLLLLNAIGGAVPQTFEQQVFDWDDSTYWVLKDIATTEDLALMFRNAFMKPLPFSNGAFSQRMVTVPYLVEKLDAHLRKLTIIQDRISRLKIAKNQSQIASTMQPTVPSINNHGILNYIQNSDGAKIGSNTGSDYASKKNEIDLVGLIQALNGYGIPNENINELVLIPRDISSYREDVHNWWEKTKLGAGAWIGNLSNNVLTTVIPALIMSHLKLS